MLYQRTVHPGGWFSLAEMAACLCSLLFQFLCHPVMSFLLLPALLSSFLLAILLHNKQRSVSLCSQACVTGLQIAVLSCQEVFFFLGINLQFSYEP